MELLVLEVYLAIAGVCIFLPFFFSSRYPKPSHFQTFVNKIDHFLYPEKIKKRRSALLKQILGLKNMYIAVMNREMRELSKKKIKYAETWITQATVKEREKLSNLLKKVYENRDGFDLEDEKEFNSIQENMNISFEVSAKYGV
jgi:hypothetical protein